MLRPGQRSGDVAGRGAVAENYRESADGRGAAAELHREANKRTQKEKGPEETLISLPSHFYLLPCERATRAGAVAAAIMQGLQGRLQQMPELRRALGIRQG